MIRHGNVVWGWSGRILSSSITPLTIAMVKPSFITLLVAPVSLASLSASALLPAGFAAVSVTAVAMRADEEQRSALICSAKPLTQCEVTGISHRSVGRRSTADSECGKIPMFLVSFRPKTVLPNEEPRLLLTTGVHFSHPNARYYQSSSAHSSAFGDDIVCSASVQFSTFFDER